MNKSKYFISYLVLVFISTSCHSDKEKISNDFSDLFAKEIQYFNFLSKKDTTIKGVEGTRIFIPENAFEFASGELVEGKVQILLEEYYKKSDILLAGLTTTSNEKLLVSGGMIHLSANSNGKPVKIKKEKKLEVSFNKDYARQDVVMQPFIGIPNSREADSQKIIDWQINVDSIILDEKIIREIIRLDYGADSVIIRNELDDYLFKTAVLGWINADIFYDYEDKTDLLVKIRSEYRPVVRLVFKDINVIIAGKENSDGFYFKNIPAGKKAKLIAFSGNKEIPFMAIKDIEINGNEVEELILEKTTIEAIEEKMESLN